MLTHSNFRVILRFILPLALALLQACTTPSIPQSPQQQLENQLRDATKAEQAHQYPKAFEAYMAVAKTLTSPERESVQLRAVSALISGGLFVQANAGLGKIEVIELGDNLILQKQILVARLALGQNFPEKAVRSLALIRHLDTSPLLRQEAYELKAIGYARSGNPINSIRERIFRDELLTNPESILENQLAIVNTLTLVRSNVFPSGINGVQAKTYKGWKDLAALYKNYTGDAFVAKYEPWSIKFDRHPISAKTLDYLVNNPTAVVVQPNKIAIILPFSSSLGKAADAVFSGIAAAHYESTSAMRPELLVYDNGSGSADLQAIFQRAIDDGAELIIGPLDKPSVNSVVAATDVTVPTVVLNYATDSSATRQSLYQFGLLPEEDVRQTAEQAALDGHIKAAVLFPEGELGSRLSTAFENIWHEFGGSIVTSTRYNPAKNDFSKPIKNLLGINKSQQRRRTLEQIINQSVEFSDRRRQDIDLIFLVALPKQGRLIKPQLRFFRAKDIPVYATSHIHQVGSNARTNTDLDGIVFCDMPWTIRKSTDEDLSNSAYKTDFKLLDNPRARLYALGVDSYNVVPYLSALGSNATRSYEGLTGYLTLNENKQFRRELVCSRFKRGKAITLPENVIFTPSISSTQ